MIRKNRFAFLMAVLVLFLIGGCATLPRGFERPESYAVTDTDHTRIDRTFRDEIAAHPGQSGFLFLGDGLNAFAARAILAQAAERSIDVQYYLYHNDLVGKLFTDQLVKAAERGVRVRILTNSLASNDVGIVHSGYSKYRKALLARRGRTV